MTQYTILSGAGHIPTKDKDEPDIYYRKGFDYELTDAQAAPLLAKKQAVKVGEAAPGPEFTPLAAPETSDVINPDSGSSGNPATTVEPVTEDPEKDA